VATAVDKGDLTRFIQVETSGDAKWPRDEGNLNPLISNLARNETTGAQS